MLECLIEHCKIDHLIEDKLIRYTLVMEDFLLFFVILKQNTKHKSHISLLFSLDKIKGCNDGH